MNKLPKISIITPVYNGAKYIEETILSIINQKYINLEYIIIDGGSNDGTQEIIKKYESHISYWISEPDIGMYHAIQKGFDRSTGEIMAWLNSDDVYHQNALFNVVNVFNDLTQVNWLSGMPSFYNLNNQCVKICKPVCRTMDHFIIGDYKWIQQENTFWRKSLWEKAGGNLNLDFKLACDFELWSRFFIYTKLYFVETSFAGFRLHGEQLSLTSENEYLKEAKSINDKFRDSVKLTLKLKFLKLLFNIKKKHLDSSSKFVILLNLIINYKLKSKNKIHYNFESNKWEN